MADNVAVTAGSGTTIHADEYVHATLGSGKTQLVKLVDGTLDSGTAIASGNGVAAGALRVTLASDGSGIVALAAGTAAIGKLAPNTGVDIGDVDVTSIVPGTGATSLGKAEDAAHASGDTGVMALTVRANTAAATSGADGDYQPLITDTNGRLHVIEASAASIAAALTTIDGRVDGLETLIGTTNTTLTTLAGYLDTVETLIADTNTKLDTSITALQIIDNMVLATSTANIGQVKVTNAAGTVIDPIAAVAHDAVDSGEPNKIGGKAIAGLSSATLVSAGDRTDSYFGLDGAQIVRPHCGLEDIVTGTAAITDGSSTSVIAAQAAGVKTYITTVIISNSSATAAEVTLRDGAAGSVKVTFPVPASKSGVVCNLPVPLGFSAATAVCADPDAALSTITVTLIGFKSKV